MENHTTNSIPSNIYYAADMRLPTEKAHGVQIMKMCEAFAKEGVDVRLVVPRRRNTIKTDPFEYYGVERIFTIKWLPTVDLIGIIPRLGLWIESTVFSLFLIKYLWGRDVDAVYSRNNIPLFFLSFFRDGLWWEPHVGSWNFVVRRVLKKIDGVIAISKGVREFYIIRGLSKGDTVVAPSGVDLTRFNVEVNKNEARERLGLSQDKYIAMYIGLFDAWKGYHVLLEAARELNDAGVEVVMIGGTHNQVAALKKEYAHVHFTGYRPYKELPLNQKAADVLVLPNSAKSQVSSIFTSPLKLFTYMASDRPIVASNISSLREVLVDGSNAILVEPDDPRSLVHGILKVIQDKELSQKISKRALDEVKDFTWQKRAQKIAHFVVKKH